MTRRIFFRLAIVIWATAIGVATVGVWRYKTTPGAVGAVAERWPAKLTSVHPATGAPTLVIIAHPHCPCTQASISELARLMSRAPGLLAYAFFVRPEGVKQGWERTELVKRAAAIPGVSVVIDDRGQQAAAFGSLTSGHTMLYSPSGQLLFSGGITSARGHEGGSAGSDAILALLAYSKPVAASQRATRVFGCSLLGQADPGAIQASSVRKGGNECPVPPTPSG